MEPAAKPLAVRVVELLSRARMALTSEKELQRDIGCVLQEAGLKYVREYSLDAENRPDFFLDGVCLEVKIKGGAKDILKQCIRYCSFDEVKVLVLVTNRAMGFPPEINGKPCYVVKLGRAWL